MELMEDLDPEEAQAVIDRPALKLMIDAVNRYARTRTTFSSCAA